MVSSGINSGLVAAPAVSQNGVIGAVNDVLNLGNPVGAILTGLNQVAALVGLNSSDPTRDQERIDRINLAYQLAMRGDDTPQRSMSAHTNLEGMTGAQYLEYIATNNGGHPELPGPTGLPGTTGAAVYGSQIAYRYAQAKFAEWKGRVAAGQLGTGLITGVSDIPAKISGFVSSPLVLFVVVGLIGLALYKARAH